MNFTKGTLENAIKNLASKGKIYTNEGQFRFDLARELRGSGFCVELEVLSCNIPIADFVKLGKEGKKKYYTDIVVKDDEGNYVAIELKYKTLEANIEYTTQFGKRIVFSQGAENKGAYYFWKDVQRLEDLVNNKVPLNFDNSKRVLRGYAVMLTNSSKFWDYNSSIGGSIAGIRLNCAPKVKQYKPQKGTVDDYSPIEIKGSYTIGNNDWIKYNCGGSKGKHGYDEFKYLIIEIK